MDKVIDFHIHAGDYKLLREDIRELISKIPLEEGEEVSSIFTDAETMQQYLKKAGVSKGVVLAECGPGTNFTIDSEMIAKKCESSDFLIPFGNVNPNHHNTLKEFHYSLEVGVKGFKFYPADHEYDPLSDEMLEIYALCEKHKKIIMFHTGFTAQKDTEQAFCNPEDFEIILKQYPNLNVVFCHAGKPHWYEETVGLLKQYPNAYADTALVPVDVTESMLTKHPDVSHKILFGSDWPVAGNYKNLIARYEASEISEENLSLLMYENASKLLSSCGAI